MTATRQRLPSKGLQMSTHTDRAAAIATAIMQILFQRPTPRDLRTRIETLLRDELADVARQTRDDLPPID
jgi:hypothetical protein